MPAPKPIGPGWRPPPKPKPVLLPDVVLGAPFDGKTFDPALDQERLSKQLGRVFDAMRDGQWRTLAMIEAITGDPQASISARLRDLRKPKFGEYNVEHRRIDEGLWEYRVGPRIVKES